MCQPLTLVCVHITILFKIFNDGYFTIKIRLMDFCLYLQILLQTFSSALEQKAEQTVQYGLSDNKNRGSTLILRLNDLWQSGLVAPL